MHEIHFFFQKTIVNSAETCLISNHSVLSSKHHITTDMISLDFFLPFTSEEKS